MRVTWADLHPVEKVSNGVPLGNRALVLAASLIAGPIAVHGTRGAGETLPHRDAIRVQAHLDRKLLALHLLLAVKSQS